jgi:hypothetical protein
MRDYDPPMSGAMSRDTAISLSFDLVPVEDFEMCNCLSMIFVDQFEINLPNFIFCLANAPAGGNSRGWTS